MFEQLISFLGRLHPLVVHLPIGILLLAALLELLARVRGFHHVRAAVPATLWIGAVSACGAAVAGYWLSLEGGYDGAAIAWHMRLGIGVAVGALLTAVLRWWSGRIGRVLWTRAYYAALSATVVVLLAAGHFGGSLTHGSGYLTAHLPPSLQQLLGGSASGGGSLDLPVDSARVYHDLVATILQSHCVSCHGENKSKGDLRLHTPEVLLAGGENGPVIEAGDPEASDLLRRVTLPAYHDDVMPPKGERPLSVGDTELIRWWIAQGAGFDERVADIEEVPASVQVLLGRLRTEAPRTGLYALAAPPPDTAAIHRLMAQGLQVRRIAQDLPFLHVSAGHRGPAIGDAHVASLEPVAEQIAWLDLRETAVTDSSMAFIGTLPHLTRLYLQETAISNAGLERLSGAVNLEYLNLYETAVRDDGLLALRALPRLRDVFLWGTEVTDEGLALLREARPRLNVMPSASVRVDPLPAVPTGKESH